MLIERNQLVDRLPKYAPKLEVFETEKAVDYFGWAIFEGQIKQKPNSILTLATGSSPLGIYKNWIRAYQNGLNCKHLITKNLDEYVGLPDGHPQSYKQFMRDNLFDQINIPESQRFIPNSQSLDPDTEAFNYLSIINHIGPSDLAILGIGPGLTCHIAFNERGSAFNSHVRVVQIDKATVKANARFFASEDEVPRLSITQGIADILSSRKIILVAKGEEKAAGIKRTLEGPINSDAPASFLRLHPDVTFLLDRGAASLLTSK